MSTNTWNETFEERLVTYAQELDGHFIVVEHVPARVCRETGEQLFSPETVTRLQAIIRSRQTPTRVIETPVYEFSAKAA
ncbi:MAG: YgiT-type zinc finger protein [Verrucomicrobiales bacterium]|jgi:YgiT-type zinc finger domain-containing protein|nr:YgiT-type zinc finger protein [Verrucomicrobiales bacterium]